ncbi:unnamed protein product [Mytilus coruscus]|uniref:CCHC-type domain-containing protein n=1 Tax=Mytilus coruscus TaxID=42192 RepID=A0A6J8EZ12_MYTCO|nr:unnamed protein product [Mytilus coruscus]
MHKQHENASTVEEPGFQYKTTTKGMMTPEGVSQFTVHYRKTPVINVYIPTRHISLLSIFSGNDMFSTCSAINKWFDIEKALQLSTSLRGTAQSILTDLRPEIRTNIKQLTAASASCFQPENQSEMYKAQMKSKIHGLTNEEALLAAGYTRNRQKPFHYNGKGDFARGRGNFYSRGFNKSQRGGQTNWTRGSSSTLKKIINPTGADGTLMTCSSCGSFRHVMANCPDS